MSPFLTDLDSRAAIKGSRDPLAIQPIWTRFGRHIVGNLTTVSTSLRDFTTHLLGFYFVERVRELGNESGQGDSDVNVFLRWEQLAAYCRGHVNGDWAFRGTERTRRNLSEGTRVTLSAERTYQILSNQKIYGLWGLYSVPAAASGLVDTEPARLTPPAAEFVETVLLPMLTEGAGRDGRAIVELLRNGKCQVDLEGREKKLAVAVARALQHDLTPPERLFYRDYLLFGGPADSTAGRQRQFVALLEQRANDEDFQFHPPMVLALAKEARHQFGDDAELASRLERVAHCETVMAPAADLFGYLLAQDGRKLDSLVGTLREQWGKRLDGLNLESIRSLRAGFASAAGDDAAARWIGFAEFLDAGEYGEALRTLLDHNKSVMAYRTGAGPWAELEDGRLKIRLRDELGYLPSRRELRTLWRHPYFLNSVRIIATSLRGG